VSPGRLEVVSSVLGLETISHREIHIPIALLPVSMAA